MIKIFSKIRQKLISEGKMFNYLKYALGEIILVVIGILIALQISTWNQNRHNEKLEQELLHNLLNDVQADIHNLQVMYSVATITLFSKDRILSFIDGDQISRDSLFYYLSKIGPINKFIPTTITYDEMKNSDGFKVIRSNMIRRGISSLYSTYKKLEDVDKDYNEARERMREIRIEDFSTSSLALIGRGKIRNSDQVIVQVKTNQRFINALESSMIGIRKSSYEQTLLSAIEFKKKLQDYIK